MCSRTGGLGKKGGEARTGARLRPVSRAFSESERGDLLWVLFKPVVSAKLAQNFFRSAIMSIALRPRSTIGELHYC